MRRTDRHGAGRISTVVLLLATGLCSLGCGRDAGEPPVLAIPEQDHSLDSLVEQLLTTQAPTKDVLSRLVPSPDPLVVSLVEQLRVAYLLSENSGWGMPQDIWPERRCCSAEALQWRRAVQLEVHRVQLAPAMVVRYVRESSTQSRYVQLNTSKEEFLRAVIRDGAVLGSYRQVMLRGGETARLTAGWTRARVVPNDSEDAEVRTACHDIFDGLRVAVTAVASEGEAGTWRIAVNTIYGGLVDDASVESTGGTPNVLYQGQGGEYFNDKERQLDVTSAERCWFVSVRGKSVDDTAQVVLCARLVELK